jgi:PsbP-like protein
MKIRILLPLLLFAPFGFGQTEKHIKVAGTKCSLIPPEEFVTSSAFSGFQNSKTGATIMIVELPAPYQSIAEGFTEEAFKKKGMTLLDKQTIDFNNSKATFIKVKQSANETILLKQILVFGNAKETVLVNGIYPESGKEIESKIKDALLSTVYNATQADISPVAATFTVDIANTDFKLIKYLAGSLLYSTDGKIPTEKPTLIVGNSIAKISHQNQKQYAEDRLKKLPRGELNVIKEINEITIDNLKGYEIMADGKTKSGKPELVYQVMLFNDNGDYYFILGQAKEEFQKNLNAFKIIAKTFKLK